MIRRIIFHIWKATALFLVNKIFNGTNRRFFGIKRILLRSLGYEIGTNTKIVGPIFCSGKLSIGSDCWIGTNFTVHGNGVVILGDRIDIGPEVTFITGTHEIGDFQRRAGQGYNCIQTIGNGCWIGAKASFVNNLNVGEACVVAAASCVCKTIPPSMLIGGIPAKIIRNL